MTENANQDITLHMQLSSGGSAQVDFESGREDATISQDGYVHMTHVYENPGEHTINIYLLHGAYYLGVNDSTPAIDPINTVHKVDFA